MIFTMDNYIVGMIYIRRFHYLNENIKWQEEKDKEVGSI